MIKEVKDVLEDTLVKAGISPERIARNLSEAAKLKTGGRKELYAFIYTDTGKYEIPRQENLFAITLETGKVWLRARTRRKIPMVVQITGENENVVDPVFSSFLASLPFKFKIEYLEGSIEPIREEHSDYDSRVKGRYMSAALVMFSVDIAPVPQGSKPLNIEKVEGGIERG